MNSLSVSSLSVLVMMLQSSVVASPLPKPCFLQSQEAHSGSSSHKIHSIHYITAVGVIRSIRTSKLMELKVGIYSLLVSIPKT